MSIAVGCAYAAEITLEIATTLPLKSVHIFKVSTRTSKWVFNFDSSSLSKNVPILISSSKKTLPLSRSLVAISRSQAVIRPISRQASAANRGTANHCLCAACLFDACCRLLQFSLQVCDLLVQALQRYREELLCKSHHFFCCSHPDGSGTKCQSRVTSTTQVQGSSSVQLQRSSTNTQFACVSHRAVSATLRTNTQSDCVSPLRRPNTASTNTQFQLRRHLRRSTALRYHDK